MQNTRCWTYQGKRQRLELARLLRPPFAAHPEVRHARA